MTVLLGGLLVLLAPILANVLGDTGPQAQNSLAQVLTVTALQLPLYGLALTCSTALIFKGNEHVAAWAPVANNMVFILGLGAMVLLNSNGHLSAFRVAWLANGAVAAMALVPLAVLLASGWRPATLDPDSPPLRDIRSQSGWALTASTSFQGQFLVLVVATSGGHLTTATLVLQQFVALPSAVLGYAFARTQVAAVASEVARGEDTQARDGAKRKLRQVLGLALVSTLLLVIAAPMVVSALEWVSASQMPSNSDRALRCGSIAILALTYVEYQTQLFGAARRMAPIAIARVSQLLILATAIGAFSVAGVNSLTMVFVAMSLAALAGAGTLQYISAKERA